MLLGREVDTERAEEGIQRHNGIARRLQQQPCRRESSCLDMQGYKLNQLLLTAVHGVDDDFRDQ